MPCHALGSDDLRARVSEGQKYCEDAPFPNFADDFDAALVIFHDPAGQRQSKTGAIAFGGVERPENIR